jgi:hypothetical protein
VMDADECPLREGSVVLVRPVYNLYWCWRSRRWPGLFGVIWLIWQSVCAILFAPFIAMSETWDGLGVSHAMQYIGSELFVHPSFGLMRTWHFRDLLPGLLDTAEILHPRAPATATLNSGSNPWDLRLAAEFFELCGDNGGTGVWHPLLLKMTVSKTRWLAFVDICAALQIPLRRRPALCRLLGLDQNPPLRSSEDDGQEKPLTFASSAEAVARGWKLGCEAVDFHKELGIPFGALLPHDLLRSGRFARSPTSLIAPVRLATRLRSAVRKWVEQRDSITPGSATPISDPTVRIFGPFPSQYFPKVRDAFERLRAPAETAIDSKHSNLPTHRLTIDRETNTLSTALNSKTDDKIIANNLTRNRESFKDTSVDTLGLVVQLESRVVHRRETRQLCLPVRSDRLREFSERLDRTIPFSTISPPQLRTMDTLLAVYDLEPTVSSRMPDIVAIDAVVQ